MLLGQEDVYITGIFDTKHKYKLNLNFKTSAMKYLIFDLKNTRFDNDGNLLIKYQDNADKWVTKRLEKNMIKLQ